MPDMNKEASGEDLPPWGFSSEDMSSDDNDTGENNPEREPLTRRNN